MLESCGGAGTEDKASGRRGDVPCRRVCLEYRMTRTLSGVERMKTLACRPNLCDRDVPPRIRRKAPALCRVGVRVEPGSHQVGSPVGDFRLPPSGACSPSPGRDPFLQVLGLTLPPITNTAGAVPSSRPSISVRSPARREDSCFFPQAAVFPSPAGPGGPGSHPPVSSPPA